jgi:acyl-CoA synthetase (AMP-forming)/AMP-acid ligase II
VIFAIVAAGAGTVVMPNFDPARAAELIERHRITFTVMVPAMVNMLMHDVAAARRDLSSLRIVFATGIYPAELENAIASHRDVIEVAVVGVPHPKWGETPRAVVVLREGASVGEDEIVEWCRERVGSMKKPTSVVFRDEPLPKSPVGKLLRRQVRVEEWPESGGATLISGA